MKEPKERVDMEENGIKEEWVRSNEIDEAERKGGHKQGLEGP